MTPRKRRRDRGVERERYPATGSALGNPVNAERLALGLATSLVGELTPRERTIAIELSRVWSGFVADLEADNMLLHEKLMELVRLYG